MQILLLAIAAKSSSAQFCHVTLRATLLIVTFDSFSCAVAEFVTIPFKDFSAMADEWANCVDWAEVSGHSYHGNGLEQHDNCCADRQTHYSSYSK